MNLLIVFVLLGTPVDDRARASSAVSAGGAVSSDLDMAGYNITNAEDLIFDCNTCPCLIYQESETTDAAACGISVGAGSAYPLASVNTTGADLCIGGGHGQRKVAIADYSLCAGDYVRVAINGTNNDLVAGVGWTAATDNATSCASLCSAMDALVGVSCSACVGAVAPIVVDPGCYSVTLATNDATCATITNEADGQVFYRSEGSAASPMISTQGDSNTGFFHNPSQDGYWYFSGNGYTSVYFGPSGIGMGADKTFTLFGTGAAARIQNGNYVTVIGPAVTDAHGLTTTAAGTGGAMIVNGVLYNDGGSRFNGQMTIDVVIGASVSAPVACAAGTAGTIVYVDDNDDLSGPEHCICSATVDDSTFDWVVFGDPTTPCTLL
jgi:hypothetical protein